MRLARLARSIWMRADDLWLRIQRETARLAATRAQRERARMAGEVLALTGCYIAGWPGRYLPEFVQGEET